MSADKRKDAVTRRDFLKTSALLGGASALASQWACMARLESGGAEYLTPRESYNLSKPENILHSVCLQCNTGCGIKVKLLDGVAVKIDGNPRAPQTLYPHLPYKTSPFETAKIDGALCPKGQAGLQTVYDPYRIRRVLKRAGRRGENRWISIPFEQAISEIIEGGKIFAHVPGEEDRVVTGLKEIWALRDPKLAKEMAEDVERIRHGEMTVAEFKEKYHDHLGVLIDPDHPDLGPKNNQLVFMWGRLKAGREHLIRRFVQEAFGSVNAHGHTTVCQGSLYFTCKAMSEQYRLDEKTGKMKWTGGSKFYWQADTANSEFIIFVGASPFEANYGPPGRTPKITNAIVEGRLKIAVVDPRLSKTAAKAWKWIPAKPGTEGALALGMIRWIIENNRYNASYLENSNKAAADSDSEPNWTNASWLVKIEKGQPTTFLRASEIGLPKQKRTHASKDGKVIRYEFDPFVVMKGGRPVAFDPYDEKNAVEGDLIVDTEIKGIRVKSALKVLYEEAAKHTVAGWAEICGVKPQDIIDLAREFTNHGRRATADIHRGVSQHTNGFYNVLAWYSLNLLIGNFDYKGGLIKAAVYDPAGEKEGQPFNIKKLHPGKTTPFGLSIIRHEARYEESTLFRGYPARRPWFPLASDVYQEILPSIADAYPYPAKALFIYMGSPAYSLPASQTQIDVLADVNKIPLLVAVDITVGETSMYADYIFPDLSYLERWEFHGSHPNIPQKIQPVRQPAIAPIPETVKVFGHQMPLSLEALILGIAEKLGLSGFGENGFGEGLHLKSPEDLYLKMVANVAADGTPVPDADDRELELFLRSRRHLPPSVFEPERWRRAVGDRWWRKVVYVLNRGGRFEDYHQAYDGEKFKHKYGTLINMYLEKTAGTLNSMTGKPFPGIATYLPIADALGRPLAEQSEHELQLITYREITQTKSRTIGNYWLLGPLPENFILVNRRDADRLGLKEGDLVKVTSQSNPEGVLELKNGMRKQLIGKVKVIQGIRPGVVAFALGFGHWAYGAIDMVIDGQIVRGDSRRARGVHANAAMQVDPHLKNVCLEDLVGGSVSFYDSRVKLVKVKTENLQGVRA